MNDKRGGYRPNSGRKKLLGDKKISIQVMLTPDEKRNITVKAKLCGKSLSGMIRSLLFQEG